jgi:hypothetical protein
MILDVWHSWMFGSVVSILFEVAFGRPVRNSLSSRWLVESAKNLWLQDDMVAVVRLR